MARVQNLFRAPKKHLPMEELTEVHAAGDRGLKAVLMPEGEVSAKFCWWIARGIIRGAVKPRSLQGGDIRHRLPLKRCLLLLDVCLENTDRRTTTTGSKVRW
jgi:hypothetical protein